MLMKRKATFSRRAALKASAGGLITVTIAGCSEEVTPREAKERGAELQTLSAAEAAILEALGETLVPGAADAGIVPYVDAGLSATVEKCLLMIRYLDVPGPFAPFYQRGLMALQSYSLAQTGKSFEDLTADARADIVRTISGSQPGGWSETGAPPAPFFYFALRGDAIDVTWGTMAGFDTFDQPYMAHIEPVTPW